MHKWACCCDEVAQSPVAHGLLNHLKSFRREMFKLNAKVWCRSSLYLFILNVLATQYTCSLNGIYHPPLTSTVKSSLFTHVHSSPLSLGARLHPCCANHSRCINNGWTFYGHPSYSCWISVIRIFFSFHYHTVSNTKDHLLYGIFFLQEILNTWQLVFVKWIEMLNPPPPPFFTLELKVKK